MHKPNTLVNSIKNFVFHRSKSGRGHIWLTSNRSIKLLYEAIDDFSKCSTIDLMTIQKILVDYYLLHRTNLLLTNDIHYANAYLPSLSPHELFPFFLHRLNRDFVNPKCVYHLGTNVMFTNDFSLSSTPILPWVWNKNRALDCLKYIGTEDRPWKQDSNHDIEYWFPMNIGVVYNGNHSLNCGILKETGTVALSAIKDVTAYYDYIKYHNGCYQIQCESKMSYCCVKNEQAFGGILFEIGRLLKEKKFDFVADYITLNKNYESLKTKSILIVDTIIPGFKNSYSNLTLSNNCLSKIQNEYA